MATTSSAQESISTAENMFEGFIADNYLFIDMTELIEWCEAALKDFDYLDEWVTLHTYHDVYDRLLSKLVTFNEADTNTLRLYLNSLSDEELTFLYYKNNMTSFIDDNETISDLIISVFENVEDLDYVDEKDDEWLGDIPKRYREKFLSKTAEDWNKFVNISYFMDPNKVPETIEDILAELNEYMLKYVYVDYLAFDRIYRLRNFKRKSVIIIDTDSNILALDLIINHIFDHVTKHRDFGRDFEHNDFIAVNMIAYLLTNAVSKILYRFSEACNIPEEYRKRINMKNEFYFNLIVVGLKRKRYISRISLREGTMLKKPKIDIKGLIETEHMETYVA